MFALERRRRRAIAAALAFCALQLPCPASAASGARDLHLGRRAARPGASPESARGERRKDVRHSRRNGARRRVCALRRNRLLACAVGANLNCGKANKSRSLPGAREFCRSNPDADNIPMAATGHDTIYAWRCVGRRAVATKVVVTVDAQGYDAGNWKEIAR